MLCAIITNNASIFIGIASNALAAGVEDGVGERYFFGDTLTMYSHGPYFG
jgi:hypothetical protein